MNITRRINRKRWAVPVAIFALLLLSTVPMLAQTGQGPNTINFQDRLLDNSGNPEHEP